ncbi:MAG: protease modulator HflC [Lysobacterales bacterium CG02_land_8_20_14_3_00_62_12]|nr:MAG: protease modulator HflC [Xanthomonadales bacterium CG02_land_8_20_14_3_00_62_12]PJA39380.1 MAG: protease modulator HflC [Xanthomonadales bacterium CG_4_9_14_3_um_filter_62_6]
MKNLLLIAVLGVLLLGANSLFVVREGEYAVLLQFGAVKRTDFEPGLHFKTPFIQSVRKLERRIVTLNREPQRYLTSEKKDVLVDFYVKWRINQPALFYTASSGDESLAESRLENTTRDVLGREIIAMELKQVVADQRSSLMETMKKTLNKTVGDLGIEVVDVRMMSIALPEGVSQKVFDRMSSEREQVANNLRSKGTEVAEQIRATADKNVQVMLAEAERDAQLLRGEGDAQSAAIYAAAYQRDAEFYSFYRSLQAYRAAFSGSDSVLVLDPKSEFFQYFGSGSKR